MIAINPWGAAMFGTISRVKPTTATEQSAYDRWMDQTSDREQARIARVHGAEGIIPSPLWVVLLIIAGVIFGYMLFFADSAERTATQGMLMGSVTVVITVLMMLLVFFNHPHGSGVGRLKPVAMERTIRLIDTRPSWSASRSLPRATPVETRADPPPAEGRGWQELVVTVRRWCRPRHVVEQLPGDPLERRAGRRSAGRTSAIRIEAARAQGLAQAQTQVDVATFIAWVDAERRGEEKVAAFYVDRFRDEFRPAYDAWIATDPFTNPAAPPTPFAMDEYQLAAREDAERLDAAGEAAAAQVAQGHPAVDQLRAHRRALRRRPVLRRHEREAAVAPHPPGPAGDGDRGPHRRGGLGCDLPGQPLRLSDRPGGPAGRGPSSWPGRRRSRSPK